VTCLFVVGLCLDISGAALTVGGIILTPRKERARLGVLTTGPDEPPLHAFREIGFTWLGVALLSIGFLLQLLGYLIDAADWTLVVIAVAIVVGATLVGWLAATRFASPWFHRRAVRDWRAEQREGRWRFVFERGKEEGWDAAEWREVEGWQNRLEDEFRVEVRQVGTADKLDGITAVTMASPIRETARVMLSPTAKKPLHDALREMVATLERSGA
jgi:hypothetical protein